MNPDFPWIIISENPEESTWRKSCQVIFFFLASLCARDNKSIGILKRAKKAPWNVISLQYIQTFLFWSFFFFLLKEKILGSSGLNHHNCAKEQDEVLAKKASVSKRQFIGWHKGQFLKVSCKKYIKAGFALICGNPCKSHKEKSFCGWRGRGKESLVWTFLNWEGGVCYFMHLEVPLFVFWHSLYM